MDKLTTQQTILTEVKKLRQLLDMKVSMSLMLKVDDLEVIL